MKYTISEALIHQFDNNPDSENQKPTLSVGDIVTFDMIKSPLPDGSNSFELFKIWLKKYYNYTLIFGEETENGYMEYRITGVLTPSF
jgi:hypothetical protein